MRLEKISKYARAKNPPPTKVTDRDTKIFAFIHDYGGMAAFRHLFDQFWLGRNPRLAEKRISKLFHNQYLEWPDEEQRNTKAIPEAIYWLGGKGAIGLAQSRGVDVPMPDSMSETKQRNLKRVLKEHGIFWKREPSWGQIAHDLDVVDIRLSFEKAIEELPHLNLINAIPESVFRSKPDTVMINGKSKGVIPDLFLMIEDGNLRSAADEKYKARLLFEHDRSTHDNPSFRIDKVVPYAKYIFSPAFKERFGFNAGYWLVIAMGKKRMGYLIHDVKEAAPDKAHLFFFSTLDKVISQNPLTSPIWMDAITTRFGPLIENPTPPGQ